MYYAWATASVDAGCIEHRVRLITRGTLFAWQIFLSELWDRYDVNWGQVSTNQTHLNAHL